jgi:hypothetical protein
MWKRKRKSEESSNNQVINAIMCILRIEILLLISQVSKTRVIIPLVNSARLVVINCNYYFVVRVSCEYNIR